MRPQTFSDRELMKLINKEGKSQAEAARILSVSPAAICQRLKELNIKTTRAIVAKEASKVVESGLDSLSQLRKINQNCHELLDSLMAWIRGEPKALQALEHQAKMVRIGESEYNVQEIKLTDPRKLALMCMSEIRKDLDFELKLFSTIYSIEESQKFQEIVLEEIGHADPATREKIIERLNSRSNVARSVQYR